MAAKQGGWAQLGGWAWGQGPRASPLWPHICWNGARGRGVDTIYFGQGIRKKKSLGEETVVLKVGGGAGAKTNNLGTSWEVEGKQKDQEMQCGGAETWGSRDSHLDD